MKERCFRILDHDDFQQNCSYKIHYEMCPLMPDLYWPMGASLYSHSVIKGEE